MLCNAGEVTTGGIALDEWLTRTGGTTGVGLVRFVYSTLDSIGCGIGDGIAAIVGVFTLGIGT